MICLMSSGTLVAEAHLSLTCASSSVNVRPEAIDIQENRPLPGLVQLLVQHGGLKWSTLFHINSS
jgi:hypothetical protein